MGRATARLPRLGGVVLVASLLALGACSDGASTDGSSPSDAATSAASTSDPERVRVLARGLLSHAPLHIGVDAGIFESHGIAVELVPGDNAPELIPLLDSGDLDVWVGSPSPAMYTLIDAGSAIRIVADKGHVNEDCAYWSFVARTETVEADAWGSPDAFEGTRIGVPANAITPNIYVDAVLERVGSTREDVTMADVDFPAAAEAVANGQIDLGMVLEPSLTQVLADNPDLTTWMPSQEAVPGMQAAIVAFGPRLVEEDRDLGEAFMSAYLEAVRQYAEGPTEENIEILTERTGVDASVLQQACWPAVATDGQVNLDSLLSAQQWSVDSGLQDEVVPAEAFWDPGFIEASAQDG